MKQTLLSTGHFTKLISFFHILKVTKNCYIQLGIHNQLINKIIGSDDAFLKIVVNSVNFVVLVSLICVAGNGVPQKKIIMNAILLQCCMIRRIHPRDNFIFGTRFSTSLRLPILVLQTFKLALNLCIWTNLSAPPTDWKECIS